MQLKVARKEEAGVDRAFITAVPRDNHAWTSMAFTKITMNTRLFKSTSRPLSLKNRVAADFVWEVLIFSVA